MLHNRIKKIVFIVISPYINKSKITMPQTKAVCKKCVNIQIAESLHHVFLTKARQRIEKKQNTLIISGTFS